MICGGPVHSNSLAVCVPRDLKLGISQYLGPLILSEQEKDGIGEPLQVLTELQLLNYMFYESQTEQTTSLLII